MSFISRLKGARGSGVRGFTLIEVLLAMVITAFIALMAYQGLSAAVTAAEGLEAQTERLVDMQLPLAVLERDIRHAVARPITNEYGSQDPAMSGGELEEYFIELTRRGRVNPGSAPRGDLQRVRYQLEGEQLWRESWGVLDRYTLDEAYQRTLLLDNVVRIRLAFLDSNSPGAPTSRLGGEWVENWQYPAQLPLAIDMSIELKDVGEIRRVFSIPGD